ncbi:MAG TPA: hypothetical protein PKH77_01895 [Anaerolineae bacterium]|nr:hypothetical protein [Anaerolineae bacterium]
MSNDTLAMVENETSQAYQAFCDYARLGPLRSFSKLLTFYKSRSEESPSNALSTIKYWSATFDWVNRCKAYDQEREQELESSVRERRLSLLDKFGSLLEEAINQVNLDSVSLSQISGSLKVYLDASMSLLDDMPVSRLEIKTDSLQDVSTGDLRAKATELLSRLKLSEKQGENTFSLPYNDNLYQSPQITA